MADQTSTNPFSYGKETFRPINPVKDFPRISYGLRYPEAIKTHVDNTLHAKSVYLLLSKSLATQTDALPLLQQSLGPKLAGTRVGMKPHTFFSELIEILASIRLIPVQPDCILTVGAGSLTDAAKILSWALANDIHTADELERLSSTSTNPLPRDDLKPPSIRQISVPTSLSGGEFTSFAGATSDTSKVKHLFSPPAPPNPAIVIFDPELTIITPPKIWLSTGVRAIDHCVETVCSLRGTPDADTLAIAALQSLVPALLRCKANPHDLDARFQAQRGSLEAIRAAGQGVPMGGSHAISHQLGPLGVGHGETSCVCLPAVFRFNASKGANVQKQHSLAAALIEIGEVRSCMGAWSARNGAGDATSQGTGAPPSLADILTSLIHALDMPTTLPEVGIRRDQIEGLAANTIRDKWAATNPVSLTDQGLVREVLEMMF